MSRELSHERALELLPWLVNATLRGSEREQLEAHVRDCLVCRAELRSQRALAAFVRDRPTLDRSVDQGFDALLARIDAGDVRTQTPRRWQTMLRDHPTWLAGASAAAAAVLLLAVWIGSGQSELARSVPFTTLTQPQATAGLLLDVIFAEEVSEAQMRALLREIDATIVAGPSQLGRYTIRVAFDGTAARDANALLALLHEDARVRFAGPSFVSDQPGATE
jgi:hypothetical protein